MRIRAALLSSTMAVLGGCGVVPGLGPPDPPVDGAPRPPFPECQTDAYAFAGRATFAELGLVDQSAAVLPEPNRPATIWVTREPVPFDAAEPGGSRMLCFEFDDGSGGSEWPVNAAWQPPGVLAPGAAAASVEATRATPVVLIAVVTVLVVVGAYAFRRG